MSKDFFSTIEQIRKLYINEDYEAAAELADNVDWHKVKSWDALAMMTDAYENLGENENARDMAILAYNRNLGGKKLVYRLTDLLIKTGDLDDAEDVFNEYCQISGNAPDSYILEYRLLREKGAPDKELIRVLEEYKDIEPDERYMYRLAELYAKNGENEKCSQVCDNIALWFKDGEFAEGAVKLKKKVGGELSPEQEKLHTVATVKDEELAKTGKVDFKGQIDPGSAVEETEGKISSGATAAAAAAGAAGGAAAVGAAGKIKTFVKNVFNDEDFDDETAVAGTVSGSAGDGDIKEEIDKLAGVDTDGVAAGTVAAGAVAAGVAAGASKDLKHDIDPEIKENISAEVSEELDKESALRGEGVYSGEKQIDGQMNMNDWMTDVREKKYSGQSTKEYSKTELDRILEEKDEKSKAYDRLMAEQKKLAESSGTPFDEADAKIKVEKQLAVDAARRDLDIRTGKATAKQESEAVSANVMSEEARPREETVLGAVLEAAGTEAVRESSGVKADPSDRMLRIESAVLAMLGAKLSEKVASRGSEAPAEVVNAAALLVKYISGEYESEQAETAAAYESADQKLQTAEAAEMTETETPAETAGMTETETPAETAGIAASAEMTETEADGVASAEAEITETAEMAETEEAEVVGMAEAADVTEKAEIQADGYADIPVHDQAASFEASEVSEASKASEDIKTDTDVTGDDGIGIGAGAAAIAAGAAAAAGLAGGVLHEKAKKAREVFDGGADTHADKAAGAGAVAAEASVTGEQSPDHTAAIREIQETAREKPSAMAGRNTGRTPDLGKMRLKKVTAEDVEANLTDDEIAVAQQLTSDDHAVDIITARITGSVNTAEVEKALKESERSDIDIKDEDTFADTAHIDKKTLREIIESSDNDEDSEGKNTRRFDTTAKQNTEQLENVLREDLPKGKRQKIKAMFDEYYDMPEIDAQIEEYIAALPTEITREDSRNGNIIIAGAESVDKTSLAKTIAKAVNISYPKKKKKVIRTTGDNLNQYGFARSADRLRGTFLVIENVGLIKPEIISEIVDVMRKDTDRMIVIAEDTDAGVESFLNTNPALPKLFNHRINMRPFTTEELVEIAKDLALQKGFTVSDEGALALYLEIDKLRGQEPRVTIDDMDALTDDAIAHARKRIKKETGISAKKQGDDVSVLTNEDFSY